MRLSKKTTLVSVLVFVACANGAATDAPVEAQTHAAATARHVMATRASAEQPANLTRTAVELDRGNRRTILSAYEIPGDGSNGAIGTVQPGVGLWDETSQHVVADRQINSPPDGNYTTAVSNAGHDAPSVVHASDDAILVPYGAASTYHGYNPPQAWSCLRTLFCQPFKYAPASSNGSDIAEALSRSQEYLMPTSGLSELSYATVGDATILSGQQQSATVHGQAGAQGYVTYHRGGVFDTNAGPWHFTQSRDVPGDGLSTITKAPNDDAYVEFAITAASGAGTIALNVAGASCVLSNLPATSAEGAVSTFVSYANSSCAGFRERYSAVDVKYAPLERAVGTAVVGIALKRGDVTQLPSVASVQLQCSGGIACASPRGANTVYDVRGSGLHRHFLFGGVVHLGRYVYDIMDVQQVTGSWYGSEHNSLALALACFRSAGPSNGVWQWTNCSGRNAFSVSPGVTPQNRLGSGSPYLVGPPERGYAGDVTPYIYDWSQSAQPPARATSYPVISAESTAQLPNGMLLIAHGCQDQNRRFGICYAEIDVAHDRTQRVGFVDDPSGGGSLASIALRTDGRGVLTMGAIAGIGPKWGCGSAGPCALMYRFDDKSALWRRISQESLGGGDDAGFAGTVTPSPSGFLFQYKQRDGTRAQIVSFERPAP